MKAARRKVRRHEEIIDTSADDVVEKRNSDSQLPAGSNCKPDGDPIWE